MNASTPAYSPGSPPPTRRPPRSKSGCQTCRRRKVRCNERRPRCSHCERLNLECTWRLTTTHSCNENYATINETASSGSIAPTIPESAYSPNDTSFNDKFNYASFMWDPTLQDQLNGSTGWNYLDVSDLGGQAMHSSTVQESDSMLHPSFPFNGSTTQNDWSSTSQDGTSPTPLGLNPNPSIAQTSLQTPSEKELMEYFIRTAVPPIIAQVETQLKWSSMRQSLLSMSNSSTMVRCAILAFSSLLMSRERGQGSYFQHYYERCTSEVQNFGNIAPGIEKKYVATFEYILATLFFLSYIDLVEGEISSAHAHLKQAYDVFCNSDKSQLQMVGKRLVSWIRLLDARAVSAGGEGLFLLENADKFIDHSSPATSIDVVDNGTIDHCSEADTEDVLFDALYQPGFVFFQKIQSFMGRISLIDPWHRSRGTVTDETEVMAIASKIAKDLVSLWDQRPSLMDHALGEKLTSAHLSPSLAFAITRTFRTYFANYHASKVHLHRVAYKHLPLSCETEASINSIRNTARVMVEGSSPELEFLPVSMLWPLLMWGSEEDDPEMQEWIHAQINRMQKVATNAEITGQVLREVQKRQENLKQRVDIRTVMHDIFNSCFAIV